MKSVYRKRLKFMNLEIYGTKIRVEICMKLFKTLILKRNICLKHIQRHGPHVWSPHATHMWCCGAPHATHMWCWGAPHATHMWCCGAPLVQQWAVRNSWRIAALGSGVCHPATRIGGLGWWFWWFSDERTDRNEIMDLVKWIQASRTIIGWMVETDRWRHKRRAWRCKRRIDGWWIVDG